MESLKTTANNVSKSGHGSSPDNEHIKVYMRARPNNSKPEFMSML